MNRIQITYGIQFNFTCDLVANNLLRYCASLLLIGNNLIRFST